MLQVIAIAKYGKKTLRLGHCKYTQNDIDRVALPHARLFSEGKADDNERDSFISNTAD